MIPPGTHPQTCPLQFQPSAQAAIAYRKRESIMLSIALSEPDLFPPEIHSRGYHSFSLALGAC
jgi:hypothetical protein